jgi:hypothetical protein
MRATCFAYALLACSLGQANAQAAPNDARQASTLVRLTALRDTFIARIKSDGFSCPIVPPTIVVDHVPSFGNYDDAANVLHTANWIELSPEERGLFFQLAGPHADEGAAHAAFEEAAHRWIFVHELGHWWQACRHANISHSKYQIEYGANRIALAYWREADPGFAIRMLSTFHGYVDHVPSPVPPGQATESYFNDHYEQLGPTPDYRWYQSHMIVTASQERPSPSFATALTETRP